MKVTFNQGIGIFKNALSNEWCDKIIDVFKHNKNYQYTRLDQGINTSLKKEDISISLDSCSPKIHKEFIKYFFDKIYPIYSYKFSALHDHEFHSICYIKIQKTLPTQGYHIWHCENGTLESANRLIAFTLYLNDVKKGGETEFLYQSLRVPPKKGTMVIWPAGYYHTHRGNPPLSGTKYIATGWVELIPEIIKKQKENNE